MKCNEGILDIEREGRRLAIGEVAVAGAPE